MPPGAAVAERAAMRSGDAFRQDAIRKGRACADPRGCQKRPGPSPNPGRKTRSGRQKAQEPGFLHRAAQAQVAYVTLVTSATITRPGRAAQISGPLALSGTSADIVVMHTGRRRRATRVDGLARAGARLGRGRPCCRPRTPSNRRPCREVLHRVAPFDKGAPPPRPAPLHLPLETISPTAAVGS